jgi:cardiolipin synthase
MMAVYIVDFIFALAVIFLERKSPSATMAWIMIIFLIPVGGIILYILLAQNIAKKKLYYVTKKERQVIEESLVSQIEAVKTGRLAYSSPVAAKWKDLVLMNQNYSAAYLTQDNSIEIITDGNHMFESLIEDIRGAKDYINIQYFIVKYDRTGRAFMDELIKKAQQGVRVRLLIDAMGSRQWSHEKLGPLAAAGAEYALFFPPKFRYLNLKFNFRNHRKVAVIDGKVGYLGGFNIGNEYLGLKKKFGYWRDTHLRMRGDCLHELNARFYFDWRFASKENIAIDTVLTEASTPAGNTAVQIVSSGPNSLRQEVRHAYLKMMSGAKKNIYIQSPYFIPDQSVFDCLVNAAQSGVDVRIMIPCMPDHVFVYWGTYYYCGLLIKSGVRVYIYDAGFLHAKTLSVDGEVCSVGSANFDIRSFKLNFETNAIIYDAEQAYKLESVFEQDLSRCHELTRQLYAKRSYWIRLKEGIARLGSDIL